MLFHYIQRGFPMLYTCALVFMAFKLGMVPFKPPEDVATMKAS